MHPGCYCPNNCFAVLIEFEPSLFLVSAGPCRHRVILIVKEILNLSLKEAKAMVDGGEVRLFPCDFLGCDPETRLIRSTLEELGATVRIGF